MRGRYSGVGVFDAGRLWSQLNVPKSADDLAATIADDEHIIVVLDNRTGEIRECGDYSGRCVSFNPWTKAIDRAQQAPAVVVKHRAALDAETESVASKPLVTPARTPLRSPAPSPAP